MEANHAEAITVAGRMQHVGFLLGLAFQARMYPQTTDVKQLEFHRGNCLHVLRGCAPALKQHIFDLLNAIDDAMKVVPAHDRAMVLPLLCNAKELAGKGFQFFVKQRGADDEIEDGMIIIEPLSSQDANKWNDRWSELTRKISTIEKSTPASPFAGGDGAERGKRRGRLSKEDSNALRMAMMGKLRQHPSLRDDVPELAKAIGVDPKTVRSWLDNEEKQYRSSRANHPEDDE